MGEDTESADESAAAEEPAEVAAESAGVAVSSPAPTAAPRPVLRMPSRQPGYAGLGRARSRVVLTDGRDGPASGRYNIRMRLGDGSVREEARLKQMSRGFGSRGTQPAQPQRVTALGLLPAQMGAERLYKLSETTDYEADPFFDSHSDYSPHTFMPGSDSASDRAAVAVKAAGAATKKGDLRAALAAWSRVYFLDSAAATLGQTDGGQAAEDAGQARFTARTAVESLEQRNAKPQQAARPHHPQPVDRRGSAPLRRRAGWISSSSPAACRMRRSWLLRAICA